MVHDFVEHIDELSTRSSESETSVVVILQAPPLETSARKERARVQKALLVVRRSSDAQCRSSTGSRSAGLRKSAAPFGITRIITWALQTSNRLMEVRGNTG